MATEAPQWYTNQYIDRAVQVFQAKGFMLRGTVSAPVRVNGSQVTWMVAGKGEAQPLKRGQFGTAMNAARTNVTQTMSDFQAADWVYETDIEKMTVDENAIVAETCGMAIGRKSDLLIMNEMNANSVTMVGDGTTPMSLVMLLTGIAALQNVDVDFDDGDVTCGMPPLAWAQAMSYKQVNDADWVGYDNLPYKTGARYKLWNGLKLFRMPNSYAPVPAANQQDFFMWHKRAVGYGTNYEMRSTVTWENLYSGWYHNNRFAANAKVLLPAGIIRFRYASNSPITIN